MEPNMRLYVNNSRDIERIQTPASRRNDPVSSYIAEQKINANGIRQKQLWDVYLLVCRWPGSTSDELAKKTRSLNRSQIARRLPELDKRYITRGKEMRTSNVCKSLCEVWYPISLPPQGKFYIKPKPRSRKKKNA